MKTFGCKNEGKNKKNIAVMIKGYKKMARINTELAEQALYANSEALNNYELILAECEDCDSKKRRHLLR